MRLFKHVLFSTALLPSLVAGSLAVSTLALAADSKSDSTTGASSGSKSDKTSDSSSSKSGSGSADSFASGSGSASTSQVSLAIKPKKVPYQPVDRDAWKDYLSILNSKEPGAYLSDSAPQANSEKTKTSLNDEWQLAVAQALVKTGRPQLGMLILVDVISRSVGTNQSRYALQLLNETAAKESIDEDLFEDMAYDLDTTIDDPEERSMIAYFRGRALLRKGFPKWALQATSILSEMPTSTWGLEQAYDRSLESLEKGDSTAAYTQFENIRTNPATREPTRHQVELAMARLTFERRDFQASVDAYKSINLGVRDRAHALSEIAWSYFYDHQYGKALGAIRALKTAYFRPLLSPENILLEMLIYRDLCQYQQLRVASSEFQKFFQPIYSAIQNRKPYEKIASIDQMILQEGANQKRANLIQAYRREAKELSGLSFGDKELKKTLLSSAMKRQKRIDQILKKKIHSEIDTLANWFLDLREQVWFLDYDASIRLAQLRGGLDSDYVPPKASGLKVSTLFWPVSNEAWIDELPDYEVLIQSTCKDPGAGEKQ